MADEIQPARDSVITFSAADLLGGEGDSVAGPLHIIEILQPAHGRLVDHNDGNYSFTPDPSRGGDVLLDYTLGDDHGGRHMARAGITVDTLPLAPQLDVEMEALDSAQAAMCYGLYMKAVAADPLHHLSVSISALPVELTLSAGTHDPLTGLWRLEQTDLAGLQLTVPLEAPDFVLSVEAAGVDPQGAVYITSRILEVEGSDTDIEPDGMPSQAMPLSAEPENTGATLEARHPGSGDDLFIFGAGEGSDYFASGNGWSDRVELIAALKGTDESVRMGRDGDNDNVVENAPAVDADAGHASQSSDVIEISDERELAFDDAELIKW